MASSKGISSLHVDLLGNISNFSKSFGKDAIGVLEGFVDFTLPPNVKSSRCYLRPGFQLFVAASHPIQNPKPEWANIPTALSHNAIPADEAIQGEIVASIQKQAKPEIPILSPIGRGLEAVGKIARGVRERSDRPPESPRL